jgi:hypothetical protein
MGKAIEVSKKSNDATRVLTAGIGRREITSRARAVRVHDPLYVKALVLNDGLTTLAILSLDVVAIGGICDIQDDFLPKLRGRIEARLGIPASQVLVHATHTHPPGRLLCSAGALLQRTFDAVREAHSHRVPVLVGSGAGREDRIMINRTLRMKNGKGWTVRQSYPCPPDDQIAGLGADDPEIGLLRIDRLDGRPLAVVFNFAGHPLLGVPQGHVTGNYPGFACRLIEEQLGHGAMALFLQGAGGNLTEVLYKDVGRPRDAEPVGHMLGLSALKGWRKIRTGPATLAAYSRTIRLPRRRDVARRVAALREEQTRLLAHLRFTSLNFRSFLPLYIKHSLNPKFPGDYAYRYLHEERIGSTALRSMDAENQRNLDKYVANLRVMEELAKIEDDIETLLLHDAENRASGESDVAAEVQGFRIGDTVILTSPTEVLVEVGLRMKRMSPFPRTLLAAFSNGYLHYGAPASDYDRGGYEVTECMLGSGWQARHENATRAVLKRLVRTRSPQVGRPSRKRTA